MSLLLGDTAPDFDAETTEGKISFHDWIGDDWVVFLSHPADFTPVCTTEIGYTAKLKDKLAARGAKAIVISADSLEDHMPERQTCPSALALRCSCGSTLCS